MHRNSAVLALPLILLALVQIALDQIAFPTAVMAQDLMPPHVASKLGLTQSWLRPINAPSGEQSISDQQLYVHQKDPIEYIEIVSLVDPDESNNELASVKPNPASPIVFGRIDISRVGMPTVEAARVEATRLAQHEVRRLKRRGIEAKLETRKVPRINLYSIASNGMLESRDAETGEVHWTRQIGDRRLPFAAIGVDDQFLSIINGSYMIQIDVTNGEELGKIRTRGTPMFGAINAGDFAMIPMVGGSVEGYPLSDPTRDPFLRSSAGSALSMPTKSPDSTLVAWGTDQSYVFVAESSGKPSILFRLSTDGNVSSRIASASGNRFFFGSENGQVYGLRGTRTGEVMWSQPFGEPFYNQPFVVGNQVLITTTFGNLVSFDATNGLPTWNQPISNCGKLMAAFGGRLYLTTISGALGVVEIETGEMIGIFYDVRPERLLVNTQSDRLYLVSSRGEVQCLRPKDSDLPTFTSAPDLAAEQPDSAKKKAEEPKSKSPFDVGDDAPMDDADVDPFGGSSDGGDADPFGGDGAGDDDPFAPN